MGSAYYYCTHLLGGSGQAVTLGELTPNVMNSGAVVVVQYCVTRGGGGAFSTGYVSANTSTECGHEDIARITESEWGLRSTGWLTHWGEPMANTTASLVTNSLRAILEYGNNTGSINLYMAHGGTSFGYWAGAPCTLFLPYPRLGPLALACFAQQLSAC